MISVYINFPMFPTSALFDLLNWNPHKTYDKYNSATECMYVDYTYKL